MVNQRNLRLFLWLMKGELKKMTRQLKKMTRQLKKMMAILIAAGLCVTCIPAYADDTYVIPEGAQESTGNQNDDSNDIVSYDESDETVPGSPAEYRGRDNHNNENEPEDNFNTSDENITEDASNIKNGNISDDNIVGENILSDNTVFENIEVQPDNGQEENLSENKEAEQADTEEENIPENTEAEQADTEEENITENTEAEQADTEEENVPEDTEAEQADTEEENITENTEAEQADTEEENTPENTEPEQVETEEEIDSEIIESEPADIPEIQMLTEETAAHEALLYQDGEKQPDINGTSLLTSLYVNPIKIMENTWGYESEICYCYRDLDFLLVYTIVYDNVTYTGRRDYINSIVGEYPQFDSLNLHCNEEWIAGNTYTATVKLLDKEYEFNVEIVENFDNQFDAYAVTDQYLSNDYGLSVTMMVGVEGVDLDHVTYEWYIEGGNGLPNKDYPDYTLIENENDPSLSVPVTGLQNYFCELRDGYGGAAMVSFQVSVNNCLNVSVVGESSVYIIPGSDVDLAVDASCKHGSINYQWELYEYID